MSIDCVVAQKRDTNVNVVGRAHINPVVDTRDYQVAFPGCKNTELTTNVIIESIYAQCYVDINGYLLLDSLIDYQVDCKAINLADQDISVQGRPVTHESAES